MRLKLTVLGFPSSVSLWIFYFGKKLLSFHFPWVLSGIEKVKYKNEIVFYPVYDLVISLDNPSVADTQMNKMRFYLAKHWICY